MRDPFRRIESPEHLERRRPLRPTERRTVEGRRRRGAVGGDRVHDGTGRVCRSHRIGGQGDAFPARSLRHDGCGPGQERQPSIYGATTNRPWEIYTSGAPARRPGSTSTSWGASAPSPSTRRQTTPIPRRVSWSSIRGPVWALASNGESSGDQPWSAHTEDVPLDVPIIYMWFVTTAVKLSVLGLPPVIVFSTFPPAECGR